MKKVLSLALSLVVGLLTIGTFQTINPIKQSNAAVYGEGNGFYFGTSGITNSAGNNKTNTSVIYFGGHPWYLAGTQSPGTLNNSHRYLNLLAVSSTDYPGGPTTTPLSVQFCPMQGGPSEVDTGGLPRSSQVCNTTDGYSSATYRYKDSTISNEMQKVFNALSIQDKKLVFPRTIGTKSNNNSVNLTAVPVYALSSEEYTTIRGQTSAATSGASGYISDYDTDYWGRTNSGTSNDSSQYFPAVVFPATTPSGLTKSNVWFTSGVRPDLTITQWIFPSLAGYKYNNVSDNSIVTKATLIPSTAKGLSNPIVLTAIAENSSGQNLIGEVTSTIASYEWNPDDSQNSIVNFTATFTPFTGADAINANRLAAGFFDDDNVLQYYTVFHSDLSGTIGATAVSGSMIVPPKNEVISKNLQLKLWAEHVSEPSEKVFDYTTEPKEPQLTNLPDPSASIDYINERFINFVSPGRYASNIVGMSTHNQCTNPFLVDNPSDGWFDISSSNQPIKDSRWLGSIFNDEYNATNTIQVRRCSTNFSEGNSANVQNLVIPPRPAAPPTISLTASAGIDYLNNPSDFSRIEPVNSNMEYKTSASGTWTSLTGISGTVKEGLAPGTYTFRQKSTSASFASLTTSVIITRTNTPLEDGYGCKIGNSFDRSKTTQEQCFDAGGVEELMPDPDKPDKPSKIYRSVKFNSNGISKKVPNKKVESGHKIGKLTTLSRKNYSFKGWWTKKSGGSKISANTKITKNVTFYARWEMTEKYKISLQQKKCKTTFRYYVDIKNQPSVFSKIKVVSANQKCIIITKSKKVGRNTWDYAYFSKHKGWIYKGYRDYFKRIGLKIVIL